MVDYEYLEPGCLCPVNPTMRAKAEEIIDKQTTDREKARRLHEWVRDRYCWDMKKKIIGSGKILRYNPERAMSFSKSNLLVSLLRSIDIPARYNYLNCTMYNEHSEEEEESIHAPVEVHVNGEWITADPTYGPHTSRYKSVAEFGEQTWEEAESSEKRAELPRSTVWLWNYALRWFHPEIRSMQKELRELQEL
ncbi:MAG: transglutaminase family protein [Candidatus Nanohaloarchaea archaeon]